MYLWAFISSLNIIGDYYTCNKYFVIAFKSYVYCFNTRSILALLALFFIEVGVYFAWINVCGEVFLPLINITFLLRVSSFGKVLYLKIT